MRKTNMHRGISILLLCVCLWASGCGKADQAIKPADTKKAETTAVKETEKENETRTAKKDLAKESVKETETEENAPEKEPAPWFEPGQWADGVYTNSQAGITITLPKGWTAFTEEELKQVMNAGYEQLSDEQKKQYDMNLQNQQTVYDLGASGADGQSSFFFLAENLGLSPITARMSEEPYLEVVKRQLEETQLNYTFGEIGEREIAGETWNVLSTECMGMVQWYAVHKADKRMEALIITVPESGQNAIEDILGGVKSIETPAETPVETQAVPGS